MQQTPSTMMATQHWGVRHVRHRCSHAWCVRVCKPISVRCHNTNAIQILAIGGLEAFVLLTPSCACGPGLLQVGPQGAYPGAAATARAGGPANPRAANPSGAGTMQLIALLLLAMLLPCGTAFAVLMWGRIRTNHQLHAHSAAC